ncbi:MAG TPA: trans-aconitate 2-methyltransferase [Magnetospirillaceae bacterium]|nr:trans-aconitate 2-methyltransferase [Magnetospirillaceae bacterium]
MSWNPEQYLKFADHRLRPALDLLARIPAENPETIIDLGCGPGNITEWLQRRWPRARITGVDSSREMLDSARARHPDLAWEQADIEQWLPKVRADVIYSNAALQWLDHHRPVFAKLFAALAPGGVLAVQMPRNFDQPSHVLMRQAAQEGPWRDILTSTLRPSPVASPAEYWRMLQPLGATLDIWECDYLQPLSGEDAVVQWMLGTTLRPLLALLSEPEREAYLGVYRELVRAAYPRESDGTTLFPFRRVFILASKP